jgi:hypothetical protein
MKYNILSCFILFTFLCCTKSVYATDISAGNISGIWTAASSPYVVNGNITIQANESLIIEPGAQILFSGNYALRVKGNLQCVGNENDSITFGPSLAGVRWNGIKMDSVSASSDTIRFSHCRISAMQTVAMPIINFNKVIIENSTFFDNKQLASALIYLTNSDCIIRKNYFYNNKPQNGSDGMTIFVGNSAPLIEENIFKHISGGLVPTMIEVWELDNGVIPIIRNNEFDGNNVNSQGGVEVHTDCLPLIEGNLFHDFVTSTNPGGLRISYVESGFVQVTNNQFIGNYSQYTGGSVYVLQAHVKFEGNYFDGNHSGISGGGISSTNQSQLEIIDCTFENCSAGTGGGISLDDTAFLKINRCIFSNNEVTGSGGAVSLSANITGNITNSIFVNNTSSNAGGAVAMVNNVNCNFSNCTFTNNLALNGAAILLYEDANPIFTNCIFQGNNASELGDNLVVVNSQVNINSPSFYNCIVWGGQASFHMGLSVVTAYENCLDADAQFVNPTPGAGATFDASEANWNVNADTSPCIDAGTGTIESLSLGNEDFEGDDRLQGSALDIGAYEGGYFISPADFNLDGSVGIADLQLIIAAFGCIQNCGAADINGDGIVNVEDLMIFMGYY